MLESLNAPLALDRITVELSTLVNLYDHQIDRPLPRLPAYLQCPKICGTAKHVPERSGQLIISITNHTRKALDING